MPTYQVKRTLKFLQAISHVRYILDEDWVRQSLLAGHFVDEARFMLRDAKAEKKFGFKLRDALRRRESGRVLDGYSVYSTVGVKPPKADMRAIVTSAGGKYLSAAPRTGGDSLLFVSCPDDLKKAAVKKLVKKLVREAWVVVWYARLSLVSCRGVVEFCAGRGCVFQGGCVAVGASTAARVQRSRRYLVTVNYQWVNQHVLGVISAVFWRAFGNEYEVHATATLCRAAGRAPSCACGSPHSRLGYMIVHTDDAHPLTPRFTFMYTLGCSDTSFLFFFFSSTICSFIEIFWSS